MVAEKYKKPDFKRIAYEPGTAVDQKKDVRVWNSPEEIAVKSVYTKIDTDNLHHVDYLSGIAPFLRGPYASMYTTKPWTIRQYAGFSTARESNALP